MTKVIKAIFDISNATGMDLGVGLAMYNSNKFAGVEKYKGAESFDWKNCPEVDPNKWHHLLRDGYSALTKAYNEKDYVAFDEAVLKFYK